MNTKILFTFLGLLLVACSNIGTKSSDLTNQVNPSKSTSDTIIVKAEAKEIISTSADSPYSQLNLKRKVEVLSIEKQIDSTSNFFEDYNLRCSKWVLNKTDATKILQISKVLDGSEFHDYYDVLPCYYAGKANIDGKLVSFKINAGSFSVLLFKDTSIYLGYNLKDNKKYFLVSPGIE
jgi:hypothetical protein